jgi:sugar diacid utilization regulator/GAF domain-containing protein
MLESTFETLQQGSWQDLGHDWGLVFSVADALQEQHRSLDDRLNEICQRLCQALQIEAAGILLVDPTSERLALRGRAGLSDRYVQVINDEKTIGLWGDEETWAPTTRAFKLGRFVVVDDVRSDPSFRPWREAAASEGYTSFVAVPLTASRRPVGCLNCYSRRRARFGDAELRLLAVLAHFLGIATEVVQLYNELQEQYALLDRSQRIHEALTSAAFKERSLEAIAATLGHLLEAEVLILDRALRLAARSPGVTDGTLTWVQERLRRREDRGRRGKEPFVLSEPDEPPRRDLLALAAPALSAERLFGYVVLLTERPMVDKLALRGVEHAATVAALAFSRELAAREAEFRLKAHFLYELLSEPPDSAAYLRQRAQELGFSADGPYRVLILARLGKRGERIGSGWNAFALKMLEDVLAERACPALLGEREETLVAVLRKSTLSEDSLVAAVYGVLRAAGLPGQVQLVAGGLAETLADVHRSYQEARQAMAIASRIGARPGLIRYEDLGLYRFLMDTRAPGELLSFAALVLGPLLVYEEERRVPLLETLEAYFRHNGNIPAAARASHLHPNTVRYRLGRAVDLSGLDLALLEDQMKLQLALAVHRLAGSAALVERYRQRQRRAP